jgi:hypothetical protein
LMSGKVFQMFRKTFLLPWNMQSIFNKANYKTCSFLLIQCMHLIHFSFYRKKSYSYVCSFNINPITDLYSNHFKPTLRHF